MLVLLLRLMCLWIPLCTQVVSLPQLNDYNDNALRKMKHPLPAIENSFGPFLAESNRKLEGRSGRKLFKKVETGGAFATGVKFGSHLAGKGLGLGPVFHQSVTRPQSNTFYATEEKIRSSLLRKPSKSSNYIGPNLKTQRPAKDERNIIKTSTNNFNSDPSDQSGQHILNISYVKNRNSRHKRTTFKSMRPLRIPSVDIAALHRQRKNHSQMIKEHVKTLHQQQELLHKKLLQNLHETNRILLGMQSHHGSTSNPNRFHNKLESFTEGHIYEISSSTAPNVQYATGERPIVSVFATHHESVPTSYSTAHYEVTEFPDDIPPPIYNIIGLPRLVPTKDLKHSLIFPSTEINIEHKTENTSNVLVTLRNGTIDTFDANTTNKVTMSNDVITEIAGKGSDTLQLFTKSNESYYDEFEGVIVENATNVRLVSTKTQEIFPLAVDGSSINRLLENSTYFQKDVSSLTDVQQVETKNQQLSSSTTDVSSTDLGIFPLATNRSETDSLKENSTSLENDQDARVSGHTDVPQVETENKQLSRSATNGSSTDLDIFPLAADRSEIDSLKENSTSLENDQDARVSSHTDVPQVETENRQLSHSATNGSSTDLGIFPLATDRSNTDSLTENSTSFENDPDARVSSHTDVPQDETESQQLSRTATNGSSTSQAIVPEISSHKDVPHAETENHQSSHSAANRNSTEHEITRLPVDENDYLQENSTPCDSDTAKSVSSLKDMPQGVTENLQLSRSAANGSSTDQDHEIIHLPVGGSEYENQENLYGTDTAEEVVTASSRIDVTENLQSSHSAADGSSTDHEIIHLSVGGSENDIQENLTPYDTDVAEEEVAASSHTDMQQDVLRSRSNVQASAKSQELFRLLADSTENVSLPENSIPYKNTMMEEIAVSSSTDIPKFELLSAANATFNDMVGGITSGTESQQTFRHPNSNATDDFLANHMKLSEAEPDVSSLIFEEITTLDDFSKIDSAAEEYGIVPSFPESQLTLAAQPFLNNETTKHSSSLDALFKESLPDLNRSSSNQPQHVEPALKIDLIEDVPILATTAHVPMFSRLSPVSLERNNSVLLKKESFNSTSTADKKKQRAASILEKVSLNNSEIYGDYIPEIDLVAGATGVDAKLTLRKLSGPGLEVPKLDNCQSDVNCPRHKRTQQVQQKRSRTMPDILDVNSNPVPSYDYVYEDDEGSPSEPDVLELYQAGLAHQDQTFKIVRNVKRPVSLTI